MESRPLIFESLNIIMLLQTSSDGFVHNHAVNDKNVNIKLQLFTIIISNLLSLLFQLVVFNSRRNWQASISCGNLVFHRMIRLRVSVCQDEVKK